LPGSPATSAAAGSRWPVRSCHRPRHVDGGRCR
jgi:hypothetical protein